MYRRRFQIKDSIKGRNDHLMTVAYEACHDLAFAPDMPLNHRDPEDAASDFFIDLTNPIKHEDGEVYSCLDYFEPDANDSDDVVTRKLYAYIKRWFKLWLYNRNPEYNPHDKFSASIKSLDEGWDSDSDETPRLINKVGNRPEETTEVRDLDLLDARDHFDEMSADEQKALFDEFDEYVAALKREARETGVEDWTELDERGLIPLFRDLTSGGKRASTGVEWQDSVLALIPGVNIDHPTKDMNYHGTVYSANKMYRIVFPSADDCVAFCGSPKFDEFKSIIEGAGLRFIRQYGRFLQVYEG